MVPPIVIFLLKAVKVGVIREGRGYGCRISVLASKASHLLLSLSGMAVAQQNVQRFWFTQSSMLNSKVILRDVICFSFGEPLTQKSQPDYV